MTRPRAGVTLVELLLALALLIALLAALWTVLSGGQRQAAHVERTSALLSAATLIQEALARDLLASLDPEVLGPPAPDQDLPELRLPIFADMAPGATPALSYKLRTWRFDPATRVLSRDGDPLVREGLTAVRFRWVRDGPLVLLVTVAGESLGAGPKELALRLLGPPATNGLAAWVPAAALRGARPAD